MQAETDLLFIYGTLLPQTGSSMAVWLQKNCSVVCDGYMPGYLFMVNSEYPAAAYNAETKDKVYGLIVKMNVATTILSNLDNYEEVGDTYASPNEYYKDILPINGKDGNAYFCWVYLYNLNYDNLVKIKGGSFLNYIEKNNLL